MDKKGRSPRALPWVLPIVHPTRGLLFGALILGALLAFELFNYTTTDFALTDLIGDLRFLDVRWATILALAFCGIDFAGIARLFTPQRDAGQPREVWYLFSAWLLAATMNAMLTWWGVAIAILSHTSLGGSVIPPETMIQVVPVFMAIMVWVIRVLIIGSLSAAGNRVFTQAEAVYQAPHLNQPLPAPAHVVTTQAGPFHPDPKPEPSPASHDRPRIEPTYRPASMNGAGHDPHELRK